MKIDGPRSLSPTPQAGRATRGATGFSLAGGETVSTARAGPASVGAPAGVASLVALQAIEDVGERRRRAMSRGHRLLDRLEALKLAHLSGRGDAEALSALALVGRERRDDAGETGLNAVLDQVDLRVAVELAKAEAARGRDAS